MPIFEAVPNISEGRRAEVVDECSAALERFGARVIHRTSDIVHNRSVLTALGDYDALRDGALALAAVTTQRIDLRAHSGVHPRIGALDVLPFVPVGTATMTQAVALARETAGLIWKKLGVPSFLYGEAASSAERQNLAHVRSPEFEGLDARFVRPEWKPDFGDARAHTTAGAIAVGARPILIAFNVELATGDVHVAKRIARAIRASSGGLRTLKALGLPRSKNVVQISLNVTDYRATPLYVVVELIRGLAELEGVAVRGSELIGCLPSASLRTTAAYYLGLSPHANGGSA